MQDRDVYLVSAMRTPIGAFMGTLSGVRAPVLGAAAIEAAVKRAGVSTEQVQACYFGSVLTAGVGQAPARQAAKLGGLSDAVPCTTVGKVCGSGLQAVVLGTQAILLGDAEVVVAGGMESMSQAPFLLPGMRGGQRLGNTDVIDSAVKDGLWDPYNDFHMGEAGELCAEEYGLDRQAQDAYAQRSYERAIAAQKSGAFANELVEVEVKGRKGSVKVSEDEEPSRYRPDKMPTLRSAFKKDGTITAANASKLNDGASALVLASGKAVKEYGLKPLARMVAYASHAQAPEWFTTAPAGAIEKVVQRASLSVESIDLFEINEAFSVVAQACAKKTHVPEDKLNVHGGAVALGHPIGASGARILTTLVHALQLRGGGKGLATLCIGGGEAVAVVIEA